MMQGEAALSVHLCMNTIRITTIFRGIEVLLHQQMQAEDLKFY
jgi:hypothetical protein